MSRRWFILAFSILFLFAFRVWIDDLSRSGNINASNRNWEEITLDTKTQPLIFPAFINADHQKTGKMKFIELPHEKKPEPDIIPFDGSETFYIFPTWPDSLIFNFREVVVDNNPFLNIHNDSNF